MHSRSPRFSARSCWHSRLLMLAVLGVTLSSAASAQTFAKNKLECLSYGGEPMLECTVHLRNKDGTSLSGGKIVLSASMPSMPMAHSIRPVVAASIEKPGEYRGTLKLEMLGVWAIQADISKPRRERLVQSLRIEFCKPGKRCLATRAGETNKSHR